MFMTMDALLGTTLSLTMMTMTMPVMVSVAKKGADMQKDVHATSLASHCNVALLQDETVAGLDIKTTKGIDSISGSCGTSLGDLVVTYKSGATRTISYDTDDELYIVSKDVM